MSEIQGDKDSTHSSHKANIIEHLFIGDALRRLWQLGIVDVEVLRCEVDRAGYDLVLSYREVVRHIQLKITKVDGKTKVVKISLKLMDKPSGCVIWIVADADLNIASYLWFGSPPGEALPDIKHLKKARHTKGNKEGTKEERPDHRVVKRTSFETLGTLDEVLVKLFGDLRPAPL